MKLTRCSPRTNCLDIRPRVAADAWHLDADASSPQATPFQRLTGHLVVSVLRSIDEPRIVTEQMPKKATKRRVAPKRRARSTSNAPRTPLDRLRSLCLALPQATEVEAWGAPTFRVGKLFAMYSSPTAHHSGGRPAVWIYSVSIEQDLVIRSRPDKYFKPAYVGAYGWIGAWLDQKPPWDEIDELLRDAWRRRAPKRVIPLLDAAEAAPVKSRARVPAR